MPQLCWSNVQQSIGTFIEGIPMQLMYTFGIAFFAALAGLALDGHFEEPCESVSFGCARGGVPWIAIWIYFGHFAFSLLVMLRKLKRDRDMTLLTTSPGVQVRNDSHFDFRIFLDSPIETISFGS